MKGRVRLVALLALASAAVGGMVACHRPTTPEKRVEWAKSAVARKLDLNEQQKGKLDALGSDVTAIMKEMESTRKASYDELIALLRSDEITEAKALALYEAHKARHEEAGKRLLPKVLELHKSLSKEQKEKIVEMLQKHHEGFHN